MRKNIYDNKSWPLGNLLLPHHTFVTQMSKQTNNNRDPGFKHISIKHIPYSLLYFPHSAWISSLKNFKIKITTSQNKVNIFPFKNWWFWFFYKHEQISFHFNFRHFIIYMKKVINLKNRDFKYKKKMFLNLWRFCWTKKI